MPSTKGRSWKTERASVSSANRTRPRSNKYSGGDHRPSPPRGSRQQVWVGGYTKSDGTRVSGYYRSIP
jgi:hypothetical protein